MPSLDAIQPVHDRYRRRRRVSIGIAVGAVLAATVYLFWPLFSGQASYFEWDVPEQYWPDLVFLCDSIHAGELPYWNPYDRGGYPFHADPQAGTYHPLNWAICAVSGPSPGLGWATFRVVASFAICGLFGLLWLRRIGASWAGALVGAVLLEAAPFMRNNWELNLTAGYAWLPAMLWASERLVTLRRVPDGLLLALATALCGWTGSPPAPSPTGWPSPTWRSTNSRAAPERPLMTNRKTCSVSRSASRALPSAKGSYGACGSVNR